MREAGLGLVALLLLSCRSPTQITFEVTTDITCAEHKGTELTVGPLSEIDSRPSSSSRMECDPATGRIGTVVVVPSGDDDQDVATRFVLGIGKSPQRCIDDGFKGGCIVARRALRFIPHEPLTVAVPMRNECRDVVCPTGQTCVRGACVGAIVEHPEDCTGSGCGEERLSSSGDAGVTDTGATDGGAKDSATSGKRVFVTSALFSGNLGGPTGADAKCQAAADAAKLGGTWMAWVSDASTSPSTRFTNKTGPYQLIDGTLVATSFAGLGGTLTHAIDLTEKGTPATAGASNYCSSGQPYGAWSGTDSKGVYDKHDNCAGFTSASFTLTTQVQFGDPKATNYQWAAGTCLNAGATYCSKQAALFCFEQ